MPSERWLKAVPSMAPNVSQSDVRRLQEEKRAREAEQKQEIDTANFAESAIPAHTASIAHTATSAVTAKTPPGSLQIAETANFAETATIAHPEQFYRTPNELDDKIIPTLRPTEQSVIRRLYRLTRGFRRDTCSVSVATLASACNISSRKVAYALNVLEERGYIKRRDTGNKGKSNDTRGCLIECLIPEVVTAKSAHTAKIADTAKNAVSAKIADNKESFKTKDIKGESAAPDYKNCPDCQGSGFWYPEGNEKGVAKCRHVRLTEGK
jgi:Mn-dependent DtxR family transcriptional regulator